MTMLVLVYKIWDVSFYKVPDVEHVRDCISWNRLAKQFTSHGRSICLHCESYTSELACAELSSPELKAVIGADRQVQCKHR